MLSVSFQFPVQCSVEALDAAENAFSSEIDGSVVANSEGENAFLVCIFASLIICASSIFALIIFHFARIGLVLVQCSCLTLTQILKPVCLVLGNERTFYKNIRTSISPPPLNLSQNTLTNLSSESQCSRYPIPPHLSHLARLYPLPPYTEHSLTPHIAFVPFFELLFF